MRSRNPVIQQAQEDLEETQSVAVVPIEGDDRRIRSSLQYLIRTMFGEALNVRKITDRHGSVLLVVPRSQAGRLDEFEDAYLGRH